MPWSSFILEDKGSRGVVPTKQGRVLLPRASYSEWLPVLHHLFTCLMIPGSSSGGLTAVTALSEGAQLSSYSEVVEGVMNHSPFGRVM